MPGFAFAEIWDKLECDLGAPMASLPVLASLTRHQSTTADDYIMLSLPIGAPGADSIDHRRIIRLTYDDGSVSEWRVSEDTATSGGSSDLLTVRADTILYDLADEALIAPADYAGAPIWEEAFVGLTPSQYVSMLITRMHARGSFAWLSGGTFSRSVRVDAAWSDATVLSVVRLIARDPAVEGELEWTRNGSAGYKIGIVNAIGTGAPLVEVLVGKSLRSYRRTRSSVDFASVIVGRGDVDASGKRASIAHTVFRVKAVSGNVITVEDPASPSVALRTYNATVISAIVIRPDNPTLNTTIGAINGDQWTLASATGFTVGALFELRNYDGTEISELANQSSISVPPIGYGRKVAIYDLPGYRGERNYLRNPFGGEWVSPVTVRPDYWAYTGALNNMQFDTLAPAGRVFELRPGQTSQFVTTQTTGVTRLHSNAGAYGDSGRLTGYATLGLRVGDRVVIDPGTADAEIVIVSAVGADSATISATTKTHANNRPLYLLTGNDLYAGAAPAWSQSFTVPTGVTIMSVAADVWSNYGDENPGNVTVLAVKVNSGTPFTVGAPVAGQQVLSILAVAVAPGDTVLVTVSATATRPGGAPWASMRWAYAGVGVTIPPSALGVDFKVPEFSSANLIWRAVANELGRRSIPTAAYDLSVLDLTRVDGGSVRDVLSVGQTLLVEEPTAGTAGVPPTTLATEPLRVTSLTVDELNPTATTLTVDPAGERSLSGILSRQSL